MAETDCFLPLSDSKLPQQITLGDLLLTVIASLGNGGGYLMRLNQYTGNSMLLAGGIAAIYGNAQGRSVRAEMEGCGF